jgi:hypothetical protein
MFVKLNDKIVNTDNITLLYDNGFYLVGEDEKIAITPQEHSELVRAMHVENNMRQVFKLMKKEKEENNG